MTALDERLVPLRKQAREWAAELRDHAVAWETGPGHGSALADLPALAAPAGLQIPPEYNPRPLEIGGERYYLTSALERVVFYEEAAWGDLGLVLAGPGSLTSGPLVAALGDERQKQWFFGRLLERPTWTFLAMTEPHGGSDAGGMRTSLARAADGDGGGLVLTGSKTYVGNAARSQLGVVFARTGPGPLGIRAVLVDTAARGFRSAPVATIGLRGVLGVMEFDEVAVERGQLLGEHLPPTRRGMWSWLHAFHLLRSVAAAMGVGVARAAHDYVLEHRTALTRAERWELDRIAVRIASVRALTRQAAAAVDADPGAGRLSSAAKARASLLAAEVTRRAPGFFGPGARLDHPLLDKWARDALGVEFMEGTSNIQRLAVAQAVVRDAW